MANIEGIIFDLDGVIIDTAKNHYLSWKKIANGLGFDFTADQNLELKGISRMDSLNLILKWGNYKVSEEQKIELAARKNQIYGAFISTLTVDDLLPGVLVFLKNLFVHNIPCCIGSASKNATRIIRSVSLDKYFVEIVDGNMVTKSKPDPEVFNLGAKAMNLTATNCLVFEDSQSGLKAANTGGFMSVGVGDPKNLSNTKRHIPGFDGFYFEDLKALFE